MDESVMLATKTALIAYAIVAVISFLVAAVIKVVAIALSGKAPAKKTAA